MLLGQIASHFITSCQNHSRYVFMYVQSSLLKHIKVALLFPFIYCLFIYLSLSFPDEPTSLCTVIASDSHVDCSEHVKFFLNYQPKSLKLVESVE